MSLSASLPRPAFAMTRAQVLGVVGVGLGLLTIFAFGLGVAGGAHSDLGLSTDNGAGAFAIMVPVRVVCIVLGAVMVAVGGVQAAGAMPRRATAWATAFVLVAFFFAFLAWSAVGKGNAVSLVDLGNATVVRSVPIVLGALCGVLCERSGVINIAIEGQFLLGAFTGAIVGSALGGLWFGLIGAALAGAVLGLVLAFFAIRYFVDQVILGVVLNVFALGLTNFLTDRVLIPYQDTLNSPGFFPNVKVPGLGAIPVIGPILFDGNVFLYLTYGLLIVVQIGLFRSRWGLRVRAVGEHPTAADTVGIRVRATRYRVVLLGGLIAGIAGASFTIGSVGGFGKNITSGKGYIALAAVIFGGWRPGGALVGALVFGFADALQSLVSSVGSPIPSDFLNMAPYIATILAVAGLVGKVRAPAADGKPYVKS